VTRLQEKYRAEVVPALQQKFQYKNVMEVPKLEKVTLNIVRTHLTNFVQFLFCFDTLDTELGINAVRHIRHML